MVAPAVSTFAPKSPSPENTQQVKPKKIAPIFEKSQRKKPNEPENRSIPHNNQEKMHKNEPKITKIKKNPAPKLKIKKKSTEKDKNMKKIDDKNKIEQRKKYWNDLKAKNLVLSTKVTQQNTTITCTRPKSTKKVQTADYESSFPIRDVTTSKDEKAEISAQHMCISINNPRPDQNESERNPTIGGQGESSQD